MKAVLFALLVVSAVACTDESATLRTLTAHGFTNAQTTGYEITSCGLGAAFSTGFTATNPVGVKVSGTVCCGLIVKACTVRF